MWTVNMHANKLWTPWTCEYCEFVDLWSRTEVGGQKLKILHLVISWPPIISCLEIDGPLSCIHVAINKKAAECTYNGGSKPLLNVQITAVF